MSAAAMSETSRSRPPFEILLVEDSPTDRLLTLAALQRARIINVVNTVENGVDALQYLRREGAFAHASRPGLVLLDLNLPRKDGREVLAELKRDPLLKFIPVVVMTTSKDEEDVARAYDLHANGYVAKPLDMAGFSQALAAVGNYWFEAVTVPSDAAMRRLARRQSARPSAGLPVDPSAPELVSILLIEDNPTDALLLRAELKQSDLFQFNVDVVATVADAHGYVRANACDIVLTDLGLPESQGMETYRAVRTAVAGLPIIVLTGLDDERIGIEALREGAQDYLVKGQLNGRALARAIRYAVDKSLVEAQLRQSQRLDAVGQLAGGVAHDFNNVLTVINGHANLLERSGDPVAREAAREITQAVEHAAGLTRQLLCFSRKQVTTMAPLDLNEVVRDFTGLLGRVLRPDVRLELQLSQVPPVRADKGMLEQVIMNLVLNARDAMPSGGKVTLQSTLETITPDHPMQHRAAYPGQFVCLTIQDTGIGMTPEVMAHIWEPFFTTKEVGKGSGLGLATVHGIVAEHAGWVQVYSKVGEGSSFAIYLPVSAPAPAPKLRTLEVAASDGHETVLLVEDSDAVRKLAKSVLELRGYKVVEARTGADALLLWEERAHEVDILLTDLVMPEGVTGLDLAQQIWASNPVLPVLFVSGYSADVDVAATSIELREGINFLQKPYSIKNLVNAIRASLDGCGGAPRTAQETWRRSRLPSSCG